MLVSNRVFTCLLARCWSAARGTANHSRLIQASQVLEEVPWRCRSEASVAREQASTMQPQSTVIPPSYTPHLTELHFSAVADLVSSLTARLLLWLISWRTVPAFVCHCALGDFVVNSSPPCYPDAGQHRLFYIHMYMCVPVSDQRIYVQDSNITCQQSASDMRAPSPSLSSSLPLEP